MHNVSMVRRKFEGGGGWEHCPIVHGTERTLSPAGRSVSRTASDAHKPALDVVCEAFP